jgi:hypothetical protein
VKRPLTIVAVSHRGARATARLYLLSGSLICHARRKTHAIRKNCTAAAGRWRPRLISGRRLPSAVGGQLFSHALAPLAELPVLEVVSGTHIIADLTLGLGKVVHDYFP